jgi:hypothetical protein
MIISAWIPSAEPMVGLGDARRKTDWGDVGRHDEMGRGVPAGAIEDQHGIDPRVKPAGLWISSRKPIASPDYMLQGFVIKSPFSVRLDPFHWR